MNGEMVGLENRNCAKEIVQSISLLSSLQLENDPFSHLPFDIRH